MVMELVFLFLFARRFKLWSCSWYMGDTEWRWVWHSSLFWTQASIPWGTVGMKTQCSSSWIKNLECKFGKLQNSVLEFKIMPALSLHSGSTEMNCDEMRLLMGCWWGFDWNSWLELWTTSGSRELFQNKDTKPGDQCAASQLCSLGFTCEMLFIAGSILVNSPPAFSQDLVMGDKVNRARAEECCLACLACVCMCVHVCVCICVCVCIRI